MNPTKYISFSLWGKTNPKYLTGAILNAQIAKSVFPDWKTVFYLAKNVPKEVREALENQDAILVDCRNEEIIPPCMWRFLAADIPDCWRFIVRDVDSRLSQRDKLLVNNWESSDKGCHFIQDHPNHIDSLLAGACGFMPKFFNTEFRGLMEKFCNGENRYGIDQQFIKTVLWHKAKTSCLMSTDLTKKDLYIGQVYDEQNQPQEWTPPTWENWK